MMQEMNSYTKARAYLLSERLDMLDQKAAARKVKNHWSQIGTLQGFTVITALPKSALSNEGRRDEFRKLGHALRHC